MTPLHLLSTQAYHFFTDFVPLVLLVGSHFMLFSLWEVSKKMKSFFRISAASSVVGLVALTFAINAATTLPGVKDLPLPPKPEQGYHTGKVLDVQEKDNGETWVAHAGSRVYVVLDKGYVPAVDTQAEYMCDIDSLQFPDDGPSTVNCFYAGRQPDGLNYFAK